jgi:hypothetical protein
MEGTAMNGSAKTAMVQTLVENDAQATASTIAVYLDLAQNVMLERLFPYDASKTADAIPERYDTIQCELAARYFLRRGGQGEINHEENGVNRQYATVDDEDILKRLTAYAKVGG